MNIRDLNKLTSEILEQEAKKLIMEQLYGKQSTENDDTETDVKKIPNIIWIN